MVKFCGKIDDLFMYVKDYSMCVWTASDIIALLLNNMDDMIVHGGIFILKQHFNKMLRNYYYIRIYIQ